MTVEIFIPWVGPSLNKIWAGMHWAKRKKIADEGHIACLVAKGFVVPWDRVRLDFIPHIPKGRLFDCTNYAVSAKVIEDGLVALGVLDGDDIRSVAGVYLAPPVRGEELGTLVRFTCAMEVSEGPERMIY